MFQLAVRGASAERTLSARRMAHAMVASVSVRSVGCDHVADPTEQSACAYPEARRNNKPQDSRQDATVVELADSGN